MTWHVAFAGKTAESMGESAYGQAAVWFWSAGMDEQLADSSPVVQLHSPEEDIIRLSCRCRWQSQHFTEV